MQASEIPTLEIYIEIFLWYSFRKCDNWIIL